MFTKRIIPCLDVKGGRVVKGVNFVNLKDAGDPVEIGAAYDKAGADELVFHAITASSDARTTVVAMVDASVGGKTGINFNGLKTEGGVFAPARSVIIDTEFMRTLDRENLCSGYAEMIKHGLISTEEHWAELLAFNMEQPDYKELQRLVAHSVQIKERVVEQDPFEKGIRKALNLGHTVGHAFESLALEENRSHLHGYAVAWGLVCELYASCLMVGFPKTELRRAVAFIKEHNGVYAFDCTKYERLYELMTHDK